MKYYHFEQHDSDGNDNSIADLIVTADSLEAAFEVIAANVKAPYEDSGLGDDTLSIYEHSGDHYEDCPAFNGDGSDCDCEPILYSASFYFQAEYETVEEARENCATYHSGPNYLKQAEFDIEALLANPLDVS